MLPDIFQNYGVDQEVDKLRDIYEISLQYSSIILVFLGISFRG
jgi:hypothetical protein